MVKVFIDSDGDFSQEEAKEWGVSLIKMPYQLKDVEHMPFEEGYDSHAYYDLLRTGVIPTTYALNPEDYISYFEPILKEGNDILYIHFSAAMSGTFNAMRLAVNELKEKYPERNVYDVDTMAITIPYYLIAKEAIKLFNGGMSAQEVIKWVEDNRQNFACFFFSDGLKFFAKSGRVSGLAAFMGGIIGIRPIITIGADGKMASCDKAKGRLNAVNKLVDKIAELGQELDKYEIILGNCDCMNLIDQLKEAIIARLGKNLTFTIKTVNPTIGAHCGPDTLGVCFRAKHR